MAEAAVEDRPHQKFYCHICNVQFENASANFTCPHCFGGFIEELEAAPENPPDVDVDMLSDDDDEPYNMLNYRMDFTDLFLTPGPPEMRRTGRQRYPQDPSRRRRYATLHPRHGIVRPRTLTRLASTNMRHQTPFEHLIQEVILNLGVGVDWAGGGNMQLILGNPGDYAWGREGLDAIVTQLLNQMDGTGPPPLSKDVIDALPVVEVTDQQVDAKLQCSVCWEDFILKECVRQLPCQHIYHEPCIRPWLELHGTCPICRQNLSTGDNPNDGNQASGNSGSGRTTYDALEQLLWSSSNRSNSPSSSTATRGSDSPTSSNSSSSNRDSRM
ncbi:hypothetical protein RN001_004203 [Aquatica leii]|uniref:RING-type E3 ubiquitin transferase n=1 Tax=Aquatica leii TaxID=1421715 RepID=A0AAN7PB27_9COLE|nr:hypothetical protein RN001_004203 [Aquatica leii]